MRARLRHLSGRLVLAEGVALMVLCVGYAVSLLIGHPHNRGLALLGAGFGLLCGAGLAVAGRSLQSRPVAEPTRAWSPAFVAQILVVPVGIGLAQGGLALAAGVVLVPAVAAGALLILSAPKGEG